MSQTVFFVAVATAALISLPKVTGAASGDADTAPTEDTASSSVIPPPNDGTFFFLDPLAIAGTSSSVGPLPNGVSRAMNFLRIHEYFCDVVLCVGDAKFPVHKPMLAAQSDAFLTMLREGFKEASQKEVTLEDIPSKESFKMFIQYLYTGVVNCNSVNTKVELLELADRFQVKGLINICKDLLHNVTPEEALLVHYLSRKCPVIPGDLIRHVERIVFQNLKNLKNTQVWLDYKEALPEDAEYFEVNGAASGDYESVSTQDSSPEDLLSDDCTSSDGPLPNDGTSASVSQLSNEVSQRMNWLRTQEYFCDVVLCVGNKNFPAHRAILAANSNVFIRMLRDGSKEVTLEDIPSEECFEMFIKFLYTGIVNCDSFDTTVKLLQLADRFQVKRLFMICESRLYYVTPEEALELYYLSYKMPSFSGDFVWHIVRIVLRNLNKYGTQKLLYYKKKHTKVSEAFELAEVGEEIEDELLKRR